MTQDPTRSWQPVTLGADVPSPAGPYSPAVRAGPFVFVSGQVPKDPVSGALVGTTVEEQSRQTLANLERALQAAGARLEHVVAVTVYLADENDWGKFNVVYKSVFAPPYPTTVRVGYGGANLRGVLVEVSAIAFPGTPG